MIISVLSFLRQLKTRYTISTLQYIFLSTLLIVDYITIQSPGWIIKSLISTVLLLSLFIPYIRQFTRPAIPIITWLVTFYACQFIPTDYRPNHIFVNVLPTLERILYGASLSEIISRHTHPFLDIMAWLPYGVIHYSFPFILAFILFIYGPPQSTNVFGQAFGYMNIAGVLTQLLFPNASPWYEMSFGSSPANYSIHGEPGGLERIDDILGLNLYASTFGDSPLVFGAFPSLHSATATIEMLFLTYLYPKLWPLGFAYTMWLWWSTMYLTHHYLIDLVGGSIYAFVTFFIARPYLPHVDPKKRNRLAYFSSIPSTPQHNSLSHFFHSIEHSRCFGQDNKEKTACDTSKLETSRGDDMDEVDEEEWLALSPPSAQYDLTPSGLTTAGDGDDNYQDQDISVLMEHSLENQQILLHHLGPTNQHYQYHYRLSTGKEMDKIPVYTCHEIETPLPLLSCHISPTTSSEFNSPETSSYPDQYATDLKP